MKQQIKLNESQLRQIVKESVKKALNESEDFDKFTSNTEDEINKAIQIISNVIHSDFIPFSSPYPSSTEIKVKELIIGAMKSLESALLLTNQLYKR